MTVRDHNPYSPPIGDPPVVNYTVVRRWVAVTVAGVYSIAVCFLEVRIGKASGEWWASTGHLIPVSHFLLLIAPIAFLFQFFRFRWHAAVRYFYVRTVISGLAMAVAVVTLLGIESLFNIVIVRRSNHGTSGA